MADFAEVGRLAMSHRERVMRRLPEAARRVKTNFPEYDLDESIRRIEEPIAESAQSYLRAFLKSCEREPKAMHQLVNIPALVVKDGELVLRSQVTLADPCLHEKQDLEDLLLDAMQAQQVLKKQVAPGSAWSTRHMPAEFHQKELRTISGLQEGWNE